MGAVEAGSWGGGGGTGGISKAGLGACGGASRTEEGGPGVVAVLGGGLAVLDGVGAEPDMWNKRGKGKKGEKTQVGVRFKISVRMRRKSQEF